MRFLYFLLVFFLGAEMRQALSCDEDISKLFGSNINSTEFRHWYSSMKRLTISLNAKLKSSTRMDMINVLKFETISFKVTYEVSLIND